MNKGSVTTHVKIFLDEQDGYTKVTIEHYGWGEGEEWGRAKAWHEMAWGIALTRLKKMFARP
jgi:hypothetical protein